MSEIPETAWAYFAGLLDGEGYLYPLMHRNPYFIRTTKKGYGREFRCLIYNGSKDLLETVRANIGMGHIVTHKKESKKEKNRIDTYSLRFYQGNLRIILPKIIPYLILKKALAEIVLEMLHVVTNIRDLQVREITLLLMHKVFTAESRKTAGNKYREHKKQDAIIEEELNRYGRENLILYKL